MTSIKFNNIDELFECLQPNEKETTQYLRQIIIECIPTVSEKLSYNVPYFYGQGPVCYLWPGSVFWGKKRSYEGVRMGFVQGKELIPELNYFSLEHRKNVRCRDFVGISDVNVDLVKLYLFDAFNIDNKRTFNKTGKNPLK